MSTALDALSVLDRTVTWLGRSPDNVAAARYTEPTLARWITIAEAADAGLAEGLAALRASLDGFDLADADARAARVDQLRLHLDGLLARVGPAAAAEVQPRARLLPEGVADARPLPAAPPPPTVTHTVVNLVPAEWSPGEGAEAPGTEAPASRGDGGAVRADRSERPDRPERPERAHGERGERGERGARGERGERGERGGRRDRRGRDGREPVDATAVGAERSEDTPRPVEEVRRPPQPPPEPPSYPLGAPEGTGAPLASLGAFEPAEVELLAAAGVVTVADLLLYPPVAVDRAGERFIPDALVAGPVIVRGTVAGRVTRLVPAGRVYQFHLVTDRARVRCAWSGTPPADVRAVAAGAEIGLAGTVEIDDDGPVLREPELLGVDGRGGDWLPRYDVPGLPDPRMRAGIRAALKRHLDTLQDHLPAEVIDRARLMPLSAAVRDVHFPSNASRRGRARLVFDELLQVQLGVALLRRGPGRERGTANPVVHGLVARAMGLEKWQLTDAQELGFDDLRRDLRRNQPMARLLQGEPGSGVDLLVRAALLVVAGGQHQSLYLAPDALTAENRYLFSEQMLRAAGVESVLLNGTGSRTALEALKKGETMVAFGTHALLQELPAFRKLGLVVVEEHGGSYGAHQAVDSLPVRPDLLVVTPTPVATTVALTVYGHLAVTSLGPGPGAGATARVVPAAERERAYAAIREAIEGGRQAMLVFPLVRGQDLLSPSEVRRLAEMLVADHLPGARIGIFNGGMSREERFRAYDDFAHRRTDLLIATSYVEQGPPLPDVSVLVVEHALMMDLTRLHQLRGHVAGGFKHGSCLLVVGDDATPEALASMEAFCGESEGAHIAEIDLAARGVDTFLGERAASAPQFRWARPAEDREVLLRARAEVVKLLQLDPGLRRRAHRALLNLVRARVGQDVGGEAAGGETVERGAPTAPAPAARGGGREGGGGKDGGSKDGGGRRRRRRR